MKRAIQHFSVCPVEYYGLNVRIYFNLHKKSWSVKCKRTNRVLIHCDFIPLKQCKFIVSEKGRQRVLKEKRKNVHAYVDGIIGGDFDNSEVYHGTFTYNPYKYDSFVRTLNEKTIPVYGADFAHMVVKNGEPSQRLFNEVVV